MIKPLRKTYSSIYGAPTIHSIDTSIFEKRYFAHCMQCSFCHDACCEYGADIDVWNVERVMTPANALEEYLAIPKSGWFVEGYEADDEFSGGRFTRTQVRNGACVFHVPGKRGCQLHRFSLEKGMDYHKLKPMVCCLFPLTYDEGVLHPSDEIENHSLICSEDGQTLYQGVRQELEYYFGELFVGELDSIEVASLPVSSMFNS